MTTHYIDITLLPDPEFSHAHLLGALMAKLHRALVQLKSSDIGVSFPQHVNAPLGKRTLGAVLRLHGPQAALAGLMEQGWLKGMRDHVQLSELASVPSGTAHRLVLRVRNTAWCSVASSKPMPTACAAAAWPAKAKPPNRPQPPSLTR